MLSELIQFLTRIAGLLLLLLGVGVAAWVLDQAWTLYHDPARIERFADAVEDSSHIDRIISSAIKKGLASKDEEETPIQLEQANEEPEVLRISYFLAWIIAIFLLTLIAHIAFSAVNAGARAALYQGR